MQTLMISQGRCNDVTAGHGRVWREGVCKAVLRGHRGRGVWRLQLLPGLRLATAGADGSIKIWPLANYLPRPDARAAGQPGRAAAGAPVESLKLQQSLMQDSYGEHGLPLLQPDTDTHEVYSTDMHCVSRLTTHAFKWKCSTSRYRAAC